MTASVPTLLRPLRDAVGEIPPAALAVLLVSLTLGAVVAAFTPIGFAIVGVTIVAALVLAALRWPAGVLVLLAMAPVYDRFIIGRLLPAELQQYAGYLSVAVLVLGGGAIALGALRAGRVIAAFWHPSTIALSAFVALALLSALLNAVPPIVAAAGLLFTLDAVVLFYLARMVPYTHRQVVGAIAAIAALMTVAALIALAQAVLAPNILGLPVVAGRLGEVVRLGSIFRDPNIFGTLLGMIIPFAVLGALRVERRAWRAGLVAIASLLMLALLLTYSRGSWLGMVLGVGTVLLILDRRALMTLMVIGVLALGSAFLLPRNLLVEPPADAPAAPPPTYNPFDSTVDRVGAVGAGRDLRMMFVGNALPILADHPLLGVGPGRYGGAAAWHFRTPIYAEYGTDEFWPTWYAQRTVDNFWLHLVVEAGVLGAIAFVSAIGVVVIRLLRVARRATGSRFVVSTGILAAVAMLCVAAVTTMLLEGNTVAFVFWFLLGLGSLYRTGGPLRSGATQPSRADSTATSASSAEAT